MHVDITIKNYRCFPDTRPARISIGSGLTAFVGVNNSGKSSLLKFFYEFRNLFESLLNADNFLKIVKGSTCTFTYPSSVLDRQEVFCNGNSRDLTVEFQVDSVDKEDEPGILIARHLTITVSRNSPTTVRGAFPIDDVEMSPDRVRINDWKSTQGFSSTQGRPKVVDFSLFQNLFSTLRESMYVGPFRNVLNVAPDEPYYDIEVGRKFISEWHSFKSGPIQKNNEEAGRVTVVIGRIFGYKSLEINPSTDNRTLQLLVDGKSHKLSEMGGGLSQFIVLIASVAMYRPSYVLVDEPELNLHPVLQQKFLTTLESFAQEGVLFATHNIGLARASADRIYSLRVGDGGEREVRLLEDTPRLPIFLGELSFSSYMEVGFKKILLVEGSTDIKTVQQFLRLYDKDHEVLPISLGGADMINSHREYELAEIMRIPVEVR